MFVGKHVATIHNHPNLYESALSSENFQILELEFEEYELVSSRNALWILKSKEILPEKDIIEIKNDIVTLNGYSKLQSYDNERIYEELLLDYINNVGFGISEDTINKLIYLVENNKNIVMYQCKFNFISVKNFESIVKTLKDPKNKHIYQFNVDEKYPKELFDMYFKALKGRKYKKKKKGKGKKGKKK